MSLMTLEPTETTPANGKKRGEDFFSFTARDVTGSTVASARFQRSAPTSAVAKALATRMQLPSDVPWALRDARQGRFLDESKAIGEQVDEGAQVDVVPKAHLG